MSELTFYVIKHTLFPSKSVIDKTTIFEDTNISSTLTDSQALCIRPFHRHTTRKLLQLPPHPRACSIYRYTSLSSPAATERRLPSIFAFPAAAPFALAQSLPATFTSWLPNRFSPARRPLRARDDARPPRAFFVSVSRAK